VTSARFARRAGCSGSFSEGERGDFVGDAAQETRREVATGCPAGAAVELWTLEGEGHAPTFDARWTKTTFDWLQEHAP
jgi:hypothetical protein